MALPLARQKHRSTPSSALKFTQISYSSLYSIPVDCVLVLNVDMSTFVKSILIVPIFVIPRELSVFNIVPARIEFAIPASSTRSGAESRLHEYRSWMKTYERPGDQLRNTRTDLCVESESSAPYFMWLVLIAPMVVDSGSER